MGVVSFPPFFLAEVDPKEIGDSLLPALPQPDEGKGMLPLRIIYGRPESLLSWVGRLVTGWSQEGNAKTRWSEL